MASILKNIDFHSLAIWFLKLIVVLCVFFIFRLVIHLFIRSIEKKTKQATNKDIKSNPATSFLLSVIKILMNFLVILFLLPILGVKTTSIVAFVGAIGLGIGIGLQDMAVDLLSGVKLLLTKPFNVGDLISTHSIQGTVKSMNIFHTIITKSDNTDVYLPNRSLSGGELTNFFRHSQRCIEIEIPLDFDNSVEKAKNILEDILYNHIKISQEERYKPKIVLDKIDPQYLILVCSIWIPATENTRSIRAEILENFHKRAKVENIKLPTTVNGIISR